MILVHGNKRVADSWLASDTPGSLHSKRVQQFIDMAI